VWGPLEVHTAQAAFRFGKGKAVLRKRDLKTVVGKFTGTEGAHEVTAMVRDRFRLDQPRAWKLRLKETHLALR
jgi:hypothetical protein